MAIPIIKKIAWLQLRYTDDPDVASLSRAGDDEEDIHKVNRLFAALDGTPKQCSQKGIVTQS